MADAPTDWPTAMEDLHRFADIMRDHMRRSAETKAIQIADNVHLLVRQVGRPLLIPQWIADMGESEVLDIEARRYGFDGYAVYDPEEVAG